MENNTLGRNGTDTERVNQQVAVAEAQAAEPAEIVMVEGPDGKMVPAAQAQDAQLAERESDAKPPREHHAPGEKPDRSVTGDLKGGAGVNVQANGNDMVIGYQSNHTEDNSFSQEFKGDNTTVNLDMSRVTQTHKETTKYENNANSKNQTAQADAGSIVPPTPPAGLAGAANKAQLAAKDAATLAMNKSEFDGIQK